MTEASGVLVFRYNDADMGWREKLALDFARYRQHYPRLPAFVVLLLEQGLWALVVFRLSSAVHASRLPAVLKQPLLVAAVAAQKWIEIVAGISISYKCSIGPGLYIGHFGNIVVGHDAVIGRFCNLSQGVTIGVSGRGSNRGSPRLGDRVYVAANAVVCGAVRVGNDAVIAANSLVVHDVEPHTTVVGVPAQLLNRNGSNAYL